MDGSRVNGWMYGLWIDEEFWWKMELICKPKEEVENE